MKRLFYLVYWFLFVALILLMGAGKLIGWESFLVQSSSMGPEIPVGSVVLSDNNFRYRSLKEGDVIIYRTGGIRVTHRIVSISENGIETKGDANGVSDGISTTEENFIGKVIFHIPKLGYLLDGRGKFFLLAGMVGIYMLSLLIFDREEDCVKEKQNGPKK